MTPPVPRHMALHHRKALSPRLCVIEGILTGGLPVLDGPAGQVIGHLESAFNDSNLDLDPGYSKEERLDQRVQTVLARVHAEASARVGSPEVRALVAPVLDAVDAERQWVSCAECAHEANSPVCDGGEFDDTTVARGGRCIKSLRSLFHVASEASLVYYRDIAGIAEPHITFSTAMYNDVPHTFPVPVFVSGRTQRSGVGPARAVNVELVVCVSKFDERSYLSALYVLMHECIVHAFEGAPTVTTWADMFAEGWMDSVAAEIIREMGRGEGPAARLLNQLPAWAGHVAEANRFESEKRATVNHLDPRAGIRWGKTAGDSMLAVLKLIPRNSGTAHADFLRMSLELNSAALSLEERLAFVEAVNFMTRRSSADPNRPETAVALVRRYLDGTDDAATFARNLARGALPK